MKNTIYVTGHKKPDTDTICSAVAYADYLNKTGKKAVACRTGKLNPETEFVLEYFGIKPPKILSKIKGKKIILVDHNENTQTPDNIDKAQIIEVIDHHKIKFEYDTPILFHTEPLGAAATIIAKKYFQNKVKLSKKIAGILLSAILSDTVIFRSPTTTKEDIEIAKKLAKTAKIKNLEKFGIKIKKSKASLKGLKPRDIIFSDFKEYKIGKIKFGGGQVEVCELDEVNKIKEQLLREIEKLAKKEKYDLLLLMATDIMKMGSLILFWEKGNYIQKAFGKKPKQNSVYLKGVMSRKKQILPPLMKLFSKK